MQDTETLAVDYMTEIQQRTRTSLITGLRELATFLEDHPQVPAPIYQVTVNAFAQSKAEIVAAARLGGWRKDYNTTWFNLRRTFGGAMDEGVSLDINIARAEVCERIVVGTEIVPARPAVAEHEIEKVEWRCEGSLLAAGEPAATDVV